MTKAKIKSPRSRKAAQALVAKADDATTLVTNLTAIIKAESQILSNALELEDGFSGAYGDDIISPEIAPERLASLVEQNNTLAQCITAMEVNIDGTGHEIVRADKAEMGEGDKKAVEDLHQFFDEVYPMTSLTTLRRQNRRFMEAVGYSTIEVIRNPNDDIVFFRALDPNTIRLMKLGPSVPAQKTLMRGGVELTVNLQVRERVFVQMINTKKRYFKEFGASRDLAKNTGKWAGTGDKLPFEERASEIIYMTVNKAVGTPYGVPRWYNQIPSVIGSRQAEELNLEYFNAGGIPPLMIFIAGGAMGEEARKTLNSLLKGNAKDKLRGVVADIHSTTGSVEKGGGVNVQVETFDSARQQDSMFETYDDQCEKRTRASFRLPPLFVGKAEDYSFASVFASYTLAEAQIFNPERDEFDEIFNNSIMKSLTGGVYKIKSNPLTVADITNKLKALELAAKFRIISQNQLRENLNISSDLNLPIDEEDGPLEQPLFTESGSRTRGRASDGPGSSVPAGSNLEVSKSDLSLLGDIATDHAKILVKGGTKKAKAELKKLMDSLTPVEKNIVEALTSAKIYAVTDNDSAGMAELCGCLSEIGEVEGVEKSSKASCPPGQVYRNGKCVAKKAETGEVTGETNDHTHVLLEGGITSSVNEHTHTWSEDDAETGSGGSVPHTHSID